MNGDSTNERNIAHLYIIGISGVWAFLRVISTTGLHNFKTINISEYREMAQWIKNLPCKQRCQSFDPQDPLKS